MTDLSTYLTPALHSVVALELIEKLSPLSFKPKTIQIFSPQASPLTPLITKLYPDALIGFDSPDLIIAALCEDVFTHLEEYYQLLNQDGLLLLCFVGPNPDMHDIGDLLLQIGFKDVVMDRSDNVFYGCGWKGEPTASQQIAGEFVIPLEKIQRKISNR